MPQRFHRRRGVAKSIRDIAVARIDKALASIRDREEAEAIHDVRQQLKRLRALIRLPRGHFPDYARENTAYRDLGRKLAHSRDADVLLQTVDSLAADADIGDAGVLRAELAATVAPGLQDVRVLLDGVVTAGLLEARRRVAHWQFDGRGFSLLGDGLRDVYARMRASEALARKDPTAVNFHEWRKHAKYHANQIELLTPVAPDVIKNYHKIGDKLAATLGDHHDLNVLFEATKSISPAHAVLLRDAIRARSARLETQAFRLGDELTAERPDDFLRRIKTGWGMWRQ